MGTGGFLTLINQSEFQWKHVKAKSYQMKQWNDTWPAVVEPHSSVRVYVEYDDRPGKNTAHCGGESMFELGTEGISLEVTVHGEPRTFRAKFTGQLTPPAPYLKQWTDGTSGQQLEIRTWPPYLSEAMDLPFHHDGNVTIVVASVASPTPELTRAIDVISPLFSRSLDPNKAYLEYWMGMSAAFLSSMRLSQLTLPGAHDAACWSMEAKLTEFWARTQNLNIYQQLEHGVRAFDIRIGGMPLNDGSWQYKLVHAQFDATCTLEGLLLAVRGFVQEHPSEFIVLDFHRFLSKVGSVPFNHTPLIEEITETLNEFILHPADMGLTLGELWQGTKSRNPRGRVLLGWNDDPSREKHPDHLVPGIHHLWAGGAKTEGEIIDCMHAYLEQQHSSPSGRLNALQCVLPASALSPPALFKSSVTTHVIPTWDDEVINRLRHGTICSCDWVEKTGVIQSCIAGSIRASHLFAIVPHSSS